MYFNGDNGGTLDAGSFVSGAGAVTLDSNDFFIFDIKIEILSYHDDGSDAAVFVAIIDENSRTADVIPSLEAHKICTVYS